MATPANNEVFIRIRLDGTVAKKELDDVESHAARSFDRVAHRALAAGLGFFYGGIARQAGAALSGLGDAVGRGTPFGRQAADFWGKLGAANTASEKTVETFGLAGKFADKDQILAVYNVHKMIEEMRASGKVNVEGVIGEKRARDAGTQIMKDLNFTMHNLTEVLRQLLRQKVLN